MRKGKTRKGDRRKRQTGTKRQTGLRQTEAKKLTVVENVLLFLPSKQTDTKRHTGHRETDKHKETDSHRESSSCPAFRADRETDTKQ